MYIQHDTPHRVELPGEWQERLNFFQRMMVLKAVRAEKIVFAVLDYVGATLGKVFQVRCV